MTSSKHHNLARAVAPTREFFQQNIVSRGEPVIISGAMQKWKALYTWDTDYLRAVIGAATVRVERSRTDFFPSLHDEDAAKIERNVKLMPFDVFLDAVSAGKTKAEKYYLSDHSFIERFPALAVDIEYPAFIDGVGHVRNSFWSSAAGTTTPLHYDLVHNLFVQIRGRKKITLFAPGQLELLYPFPKRSLLAHFSRVDIERPDFIKFPKFQKAARLEFTLAPGEMLYIPPCWWHQVRSLDAAISMSFWWKQRWTGYLARPALRLCYPLLKDLMRSFRAPGKREIN